MYLLPVIAARPCHLCHTSLLVVSGAYPCHLSLPSNPAAYPCQHPCCLIPASRPCCSSLILAACLRCPCLLPVPATHACHNSQSSLSPIPPAHRCLPFLPPIFTACSCRLSTTPCHSSLPPIPACSCRPFAVTNRCHLSLMPDSFLLLIAYPCGHSLSPILTGCPSLLPVPAAHTCHSQSSLSPMPAAQRCLPSLSPMTAACVCCLPLPVLPIHPCCPYLPFVTHPCLPSLVTIPAFNCCHLSLPLTTQILSIPPLPTTSH